MGLTLVRHLIQLHGGSVSAASEGSGRGCIFTVTLPAAPEAERKSEDAAPETAGSPATAKRVLVVEDNPDGRKTLQLMLELWGHRVETAADGPAGVAKAIEAAPEVALIDIGLPGLDGYGVARQIRDRFGDRVFLAAMTGYGPPHDLRRARDAGFDTHLTKPIAPDALQELLREPIPSPGGA
jgi:CheY-like chemotaxis protein